MFDKSLQSFRPHHQWGGKRDPRTHRRVRTYTTVVTCRWGPFFPQRHRQRCNCLVPMRQHHFLSCSCCETPAMPRDRPNQINSDVSSREILRARCQNPRFFRSSAPAPAFSPAPCTPPLFYTPHHYAPGQAVPRSGSYCFCWLL
jgi:hypothetical protein